MGTHLPLVEVLRFYGSVGSATIAINFQPLLSWIVPELAGYVELEMPQPQAFPQDAVARLESGFEWQVWADGGRFLLSSRFDQRSNEDCQIGRYGGNRVPSKPHRVQSYASTS